MLGISLLDRVQPEFAKRQIHHMCRSESHTRASIDPLCSIEIVGELFWRHVSQLFNEPSGCLYWVES